MKTTTEKLAAKKISRKDALKKAGMYAAFTAAASTVLLAPKAALAQSPPVPGWGDIGRKPYTPPVTTEPSSPEVNQNVTRET
jgi:hypothetical protein